MLVPGGKPPKRKQEPGTDDSKSPETKAEGKAEPKAKGKVKAKAGPSKKPKVVKE